MTQHAGADQCSGCMPAAGQPALAQVRDAHVQVTFREALPLVLHDSSCWRTDGNSPVRIGSSGSLVFFSSYAPIGHTLRRAGDVRLRFDAPAVPVELRGDPDGRVGKWIEAIWEDPSGLWHGWYHGEEPAPGSDRLFVPFIGRAVSRDAGRSWTDCQDVLRLPLALADCSWASGFFAGGFGDLSAVADRTGATVYLFFTSYQPDEAMQGICVLRQSAKDPAGPVELWTRAGWSTDRRDPLLPILPVRRGWRHHDPDGFWGPAVHYNRSLGAYVMLLNHTAGGSGDLVQEGIYASINASPSEPARWSKPLRLVHGGGWYPQVIGLEAGCGDHEAGTVARFFMAGFSAWLIEFAVPSGSCDADSQQPLSCSRPEFARLFGADRRCPW